MIYDRKFFLSGLGVEKVSSHNDVYFHALNVLKDLAGFNNWKDRKILDYGCSFGGAVEYMREFGAHGFGLDCSKWCIDNSLAKEYIQICDFEIDALPFKDEFFDNILSIEVMEHIHEDKLDFAIREMSRVLKQDSISMYTIAIEGTEERDGHCTLKSTEWWVEKFNKNGFKFIEDSMELSQKYYVVRGNNWRVLMMKRK